MYGEMVEERRDRQAETEIAPHGVGSEICGEKIERQDKGSEATSTSLTCPPFRVWSDEPHPAALAGPHVCQ